MNLFSKASVKALDSRKNSALGRGITSIASAKDELYHEPELMDPRRFIKNDSTLEYFGLDHLSNDAVYLPKNAINHELFCGITRSGKGVLAGVKAYEAICQEKGLIYIDVKQEDFTPQIIFETLEAQGREDDLVIVNWPNDFGYSGFNEDDTLIEAHEKLCEVLELTPSDDAAVDYYRSVERMTLYSILEKGMNHYFRLGFIDILEFIRVLIDDFTQKVIYDREIIKTKPNMNLLESSAKRYFDEELLLCLNFTDKNIEALGSLHIKLFELSNGAVIYNAHSIDEALYKNKVLYIKADMLNISSLKLLKLLFVDITQRVRKRKCNAVLIADEISFYATPKLSAMLATMAGFGLKMILQLQDLAQLGDDVIKNAILTNCSVKLFYKISDTQTLEYVEQLGGVELVTKYTERGIDKMITQESEPLLNATRIRAMWFQKHAILISEYLNTALFVHTSHIPVRNIFDWKPYKLINNSLPTVKYEKHFIVKSTLEQSDIGVGLHHQQNRVDLDEL